MHKDTIQTFSILGISVDTSTDPSQSSKDLKSLWDRVFYDHIKESIPQKLDSNLYCVYDHYQPIDSHLFSLRATIGCKVDPETPPSHDMSLAIVHQGGYQHYNVRGPFPETIVSQWSSIWTSNPPLPRSFVSDFEVYSEKFEDPHSPEMDIFVGVSS